MALAGFVKLPRSLHQQLAKLPHDAYFAILDLLVTANYEASATSDGLVVKRGQVLTSLASLSDRWGVSVKRTRTILQILQGMDLVTITGTGRGKGRGTLLTLEFYASSQGEGQGNGQGIGHESGHLLKKMKKGEEDKESFIPFAHPSLEEVKEYDRTNDLHRDPVSFFRFHNPAWTDGSGQPIYDWRKYYRNWCAPPKQQSVSDQLERLFGGT